MDCRDFGATGSEKQIHVVGACEVVCWQRVRVGGACSPPPPVAAALVPRCALLVSWSCPQHQLKTRSETGTGRCSLGPLSPSGSLVVPVWSCREPEQLPG